MSAQPSISALVNNVKVKALVDSGCTRSILSPSVARRCCIKPTKCNIVMMNGEHTKSYGTSSVHVSIGGESIVLSCLVTDILKEYDMLLGMDAITALGGVLIDREGVPEFGCSASEHVLEIEDPDFVAHFTQGRWVVRWKWKEGAEAPVLENNMAQYGMAEETLRQFNLEVEEWIRDGWLQPYNGKHDGLIPLMAVVQNNKGSKVRPVLDFRELNQYLSTHTGESEVCAEKLRKWRKMGTSLKLLDLRKAYLQIHVDPAMWKYQVVEFKGKKYCLTRLGFGLSSAPKIMSKILNKVLEMDENVRAGTDSYVDDIVVNESKVSCQQVIQHLKSYGLEAKPPSELNGGRVLGLRIEDREGELWWVRDNQCEKIVPQTLTKRNLFSMCGQIIGHFPVATWLRPACSFIKRTTSELNWNDVVTSKTLKLMNEVMAAIREKDPVEGRWEVKKMGRGRVWCDASALAVGVCLEVDGAVIEDASWLRKEGDSVHINLAELEAVIKGVNLAVRWELEDLEILTDSATVYGWLKSLITKERRIVAHGLSEVLVKRRLKLLEDLFHECHIEVSVTLIKSFENRADKLTRVPHSWLKSECAMVAVESNHESVLESQDERMNIMREMHSWHHFGVKRSLYVAHQCRPELGVTEEEMKRVVNACIQCRSIDPPPVKWEKGHLSVEQIWKRLACDVTHFREKKYLSIIDCGPSRFAIWRLLPSESSQAVTKALEGIFRERGPPEELLMDNSLSFRSKEVEDLCQMWCVKRLFRCAYKPRGNAIVERNHRTIKRMAARTGKSIEEMVFWYNFAAKDMKSESSPSAKVYRYKWKCPGGKNGKDDEVASPVTGYVRGGSVFVKPEGARCTSSWSVGTITGPGGSSSVEVDGMPRHVSDIRLANGEASGSNFDGTTNNGRPQRERRLPLRFQDYEMEPGAILRSRGSVNECIDSECASVDTC
jgi:ribonuclease HI